MKQKEIPPHGGKLVDRIARGEEREEYLEISRTSKRIHLNHREVSDLEMISIGAFSPLEGFMGKDDYESVVAGKRLASGVVWTIPVTLAVSSDEARELKEGDLVNLCDNSGAVLGLIRVEDKYAHAKEREAELVYLTQDPGHPGVDYVYKSKEILLGGKVILLERPSQRGFSEYRLDPAETRRLFKEKGWKRIVGFQTRNPIHRAHEYLIKCAMEIVDGLFLNPLVGETKEGDVPAEVRMKCYEVLLERYFPRERVILAVLDTAMRYAGPREAVFHAIVRKNFGCTHFIVGRDHAGVGKFYGSFDAHYIFDEFEADELNITPLFFDHSFFCRRCGGMSSARTCPHSEDEHLSLSGTKVRQLLAAGEIPPPEFTRPEVADVLIEAYQKGVL